MAKVKRNFRKLNGGCIYRPWKNWAEGDVVVGKFIRQDEDMYHKPNWIIEIEETEFTNEEDNLEVGKHLGLNSCGSLDKAMEKNEVMEGTIIQIEYTGKIMLEKGPFAGKEAHTVILSVADGDSDGEPTPSDAVSVNDGYDL